MSKGFVYILINTGLKKNLLKIGRTTRNPEIRSEELSKGTGVPLPYFVAYSEETCDCELAESLIHKRLSYCRVNESREFFVLPLKDAIKEINKVCESIVPEESIDELLDKADAFYEEEEHEKAISYWLKAADKGNPKAQYYLWRMHQEGWGGLENFEIGITYLKRAANHNYSKAQIELATYYAEQIIGGDMYAEKAIYWGKKAADNNEYMGAVIVGNMLAVDRPGIIKNEIEANVWFKIAADKGEPYAMYQLGCSYEGGLGVNRDIDKAVEYYKLAANAGNAQAQKRLTSLTDSDTKSPNN